MKISNKKQGSVRKRLKSYRERERATDRERERGKTKRGKQKKNRLLKLRWRQRAGGPLASHEEPSPPLSTAYRVTNHQDMAVLLPGAAITNHQGRERTRTERGPPLLTRTCGR